MTYLKALEYARWLTSWERPEEFADHATVLLARALLNADEDLRGVLAGRESELAARLKHIAVGDWNHGNLRTGLSVMEYAREALAAYEKCMCEMGSRCPVHGP